MPVIDLHMHTTASDGTFTPEELVERVHHAGIRTMSVTDHDTMAAVERATRAAQAYGITVLPGIEITAVHGGKDVHVLAYFLPESAPGLQELLTTQRNNRVERAGEIARRLAALGAPIDMAPLIEGAARTGGKALARPQIARALIEAGHVATVAEAFERFLSEDGPAYVPHRGASPADVVQLIRAGGGLASMAHPGYTKKDAIIPELVEAGLDAIEAFHSSHDSAAEARYVQLADELGVAVTGGSDYHGEGTRRAEFFGVTQLPVERFDAFVARLSATSGAAAAHGRS
jgi:3',5'-nucleoside bisphosphate phosphatase